MKRGKTAGGEHVISICMVGHVQWTRMTRGKNAGGGGPCN